MNNEQRKAAIVELNTLQEEALNAPRNLEELTRQYAEGQAAIQELALLKPLLAHIIATLPKQQVKLSLSDQTKLGEFALQAKREEKSGSILFRAVKSL